MSLDATTVYPSSDPEFVSFPSRRSVVHSTKGIVACTQPLAARCGQKILQAGGNAADAAVAVAAGLNMTEPTSTGIGGDMFCLFYNAKTRKVHALNGSGRSALDTTLESVCRDAGLEASQGDKIPMSSVHAVTVPGAAAGWVDTVEKFGSGKLALKDVLAPAIELGEEGFPVSELSAVFWRACEDILRTASPNFGELLKDDPRAKDQKRPPACGELFSNVALAHSFRLLAQHGKSGFYKGEVAEALCKVVQDRGGHISKKDLNHHLDLGSEEVDATSLLFKGQGVLSDQSFGLDGQESAVDSSGLELWEHPPNGQGLVALIALGILQELERTHQIPTFTSGDHNSATYLHAIVESLRIAFADARYFITDPNVVKVPVQELLSPSYLASRATLFNPERASPPLDHGSLAQNRCDTVYFAATDSEGNACSFINSVFGGFGSGIIPKECGFTLQNRGAAFSLDKDHPNVYAPGKRPYHTIIPAMATNASDGSLHSVYGVMGGAMQPQGHVQVLLNMTAFKYTPQTALDAPRICIGAGFPSGGKKKLVDRRVYLEEGITEEVAQKLREMGHEVEFVTGWKRGLFGRGQIIRCHVEDGTRIYSAGSDPRGDGSAFPA